eukprot:1144927-Pelagomonas_calceolata.AAC.2
MHSNVACKKDPGTVKPKQMQQQEVTKALAEQLVLQGNDLPLLLEDNVDDYSKQLRTCALRPPGVLNCVWVHNWAAKLKLKPQKLHC